MFFQQTSTKTKKTLQYSMTNTCNHKHIQTKYMNTSDQKKKQCLSSLSQSNVLLAYKKLILINWLAEIKSEVLALYKAVWKAIDNQFEKEL